MNNAFSQKIASATKWSSISEIGAKLVVPVVNMILARLLTPEDFGIVATLTMIVSFAEVFSESGCPRYLVQHEFIDENDFEKATNVAFWTNTIFAIVLWGVITIFVTPIVNLAGSPGYEKATIIMAAQIPLLSISDMLKARFRRNFNFKGLFVARITTAMVPLLVTVPLALICKSYWALIIGTLTRDIVNLVVLFHLSRWKPRCSFSFQKLKEMFSFTVWSIAESFTVWMSLYIGTFIVGNALSVQLLGLYKTTITTVSSYMTIITAIITPVLFATLSRCQTEDKLFVSIFLKFQRMVAIVVFPLGVGMLVYRELATLILLGSQWSATADFLGIWALTSAIVIVISNLNSELIRSKGKPQLSVLVQVLHLAVVIPALHWAVQKDYDTLAVMHCISKLSIVAVSMFVVGHFFGLKCWNVIKNVAGSFFASLIMGIFASSMVYVSSNYMWQAVSILLSIFVYAVALIIIPAGRRALCEIPNVKRILEKNAIFAFLCKIDEAERIRRQL